MADFSQGPYSGTGTTSGQTGNQGGSAEGYTTSSNVNPPPSGVKTWKSWYDTKQEKEFAQKLTQRSAIARFDQPGVRPVPIVYGLTKIEAMPLLVPSDLATFNKLIIKFGTGSVFPTIIPPGTRQGCVLGLCEGPITGVSKLWVGEKYYAGLAYPGWANPFILNLGARTKTSAFTFTPKNSRLWAVTVPSSGPYRCTITDPGYWPPAKMSGVYSALAGTPLVQNTTSEGSLADGQYYVAATYIAFHSAQAGVGFNVKYAIAVNPEYNSYRYGGTATLANYGLFIGDGSFPPIYAEVDGLLGGGVTDANPSDIIYDLLTNQAYGLGLSTSDIDFSVGQSGAASSSFAYYCQAQDLLQSVAITEQQSAAEIVQKIASGSDGVLVWSDGKLRIFPYAEGDVGAFDSWQTPAYNVGNDDILGDITIRTDGSLERPNEVPVKFIERAAPSTTPPPAAGSGYIETQVSQPETSSQQATGVRKAQTVETFLHSKTAAAKLSQILSQRSTYYLNEYSLTLSSRFIMLEPFDIITVTDAQLGFDQKPMRITSMIRNSDRSIGVSAIDWLGQVFGDVPVLEEGAPQLPIPQPDPTYVGGSYIRLSPVEPQTKPEILIAACPLQPDNFGGYEAWVSWDDVTFTRAGLAEGGTFGHVIGTTLPAGLPLDTTNTVRIDCEQSQGIIPDANVTDRDSLISQLIIGDEVVAYANSDLVGGEEHTYDVSSMLRGQKGSASAEHIAGTRCLLVDEHIIRVPIERNRAGQLLYVKLLGVNKSGIVTQALADVTSLQYTVPLVQPLVQSVPLVEKFDAFDLTRWTVESGGGVLSVQYTGVAGGRALRCTGEDTIVTLNTNVQIDPTKTYCVSVRFRQVTDPPGGSKYFCAGLYGVLADGITYNGRNGLTTNADAYLAVATAALTAGADYTTTRSYFHGLATPGTHGNAIILTPGQLRTDTRYARLWIRMNSGATGTTGAQEVDEISIEECPAGQQIVPYSMTADRIAAPISLNLWPNANSEATAPLGAIIEANGPNPSLVLPEYNAASEFGDISSANPYAGTKHRRLTGPVGSARRVCHWVRASPGQTYFLEAMAKRVSGDGSYCIRIRAFDSSFTDLGYGFSDWKTTGTYARYYCQYLTPATTTWVCFELWANGYLTQNTVVDFDSIQAYLDPGFYRVCGKVNANGTLAYSYGAQQITLTALSTGRYQIDEVTGGVSWSNAVVILTPGYGEDVVFGVRTTASSVQIETNKRSDGTPDNSVFYFTVQAF
jgi:hypothetical protein